MQPVVIAANTSPATAARLISRGVGIHCGIITCTLYIYRGTTRTIDSYVARYANTSITTITAAFAAACLPLGGVASVLCAAEGAIAGAYSIDQFNYAAAHHECIAIKFILPSTPIGIAPNNGTNCHN